MVQTQATSTNLFHEATLSAASFDNSSAECKGGKCKVFAIANDGVGQSADDRTFYQSASDSSCANQWVQADFEVPATMIENFTIQYDTFGWTFQGSKNYFQVLLNPNSSSPIDFSSSTSCVISNVTNTNIVSRLDTCTFSKQPTTAVDGVRFTWGLEMPSGASACQMNIDEIVMMGIASSADTIPSPVMDGFSGSESGKVHETNSLSPGAIAGITIGVVVVVLAAALIGLRQYNLKRRQRTGRV